MICPVPPFRALLILASTVLFLSPAASAGEPSTLACRDDLIEVMFAWDAKVRLRDGIPADPATGAMAGVEERLAALSWHEWRRLCDVPESTFDAWERAAAAKGGDPVYNLNNIYRLEIPKGHDVWKICEDLEALPGVLTARPMPLPAPPPVYDYEYMQYYLDPANNSPYPTGIDAEYAWTQTWGNGAGATVCDLEYSWNRNHADISKAAYPWCEINTNTLVDPFSDDHHGTAVLGELVSDRNGWGTSGICYGSNLRTCGTNFIVPGTPPDTTWDVPAAIAMAAAALQAGDVILLEQQWDYDDTTTAHTDFIPIEWWTNWWPGAQTYNGVYAAIAAAVGNGISVVEAGGNGGNAAGTGVNTGLLSWYGDSGAIIVGGGGAWPGGTWVETDLERCGYSSYGPRFDLQGWGEDVATTGYGHLYNQGGYDSLFTHMFSGTSSASPIVAGAVACVVGHWKATISTTPPSPSYIRNLLKTTGTPQVFGPPGNIGPRPDLLAAFALLGVQWVDATVSPLDPTDQSTGIAWGDYDGDGDLDLFIARASTYPNRLCRNDGGAWVDVAAGPILGGERDISGLWGDYDDDGDLDIFVLRGAAQLNALLRNDGGDVFTDVSSFAASDTGNTQTGAWGDYDNDGDIDMYVGNMQGAGGSSKNRLYRNDGGQLVDVTAPPLDDTGSSAGVSWSDYDDDGDLDIYVANYTGPNRLYRNEGNEVFVNATSGPLGSVGTSAVAAWGDYDNDGDLDMYLANGTAAYPNRLLQNQGGGVFTDVTPSLLAETNPTYAAQWADLDHNGHLDLYIANYGVANRLYMNQGSGVFADYLLDPPCDSRGGICAALGDYDGDGDLDIYNSHYSLANKLYRNDGASAWPWLHVDLAGAVSNSRGIGARIEVITGAGTGGRRAQIREVEAGGGYLAPMNSLTAEFGLGTAGIVDSIIVLWPSGNVSIRTAVTANQKIVIEEIVTDVADGGGAGVPGLPFALHPNSPNPFNPATTIRYDLPCPSPVTLRVYDVSGRLVRVLVDGEVRTEGRHTALWRGRDERNREVGSGVYFYRLDAGPFTETRKLVLIR
ncbi:MAG: FG-GAP-like repeat-containing protein [Candidatus Eisenbacteria bacterium]